MIYAKNVEILREYFKESNSGLEKILSLSNGYISGIEKNETNNPGKLLLALKDKGISTDWFLTGEGEMFLSKPSRGIVKSSEGHKVPLLRQKVSCGSGQHWDDEQNIEKYVDIYTIFPRLSLGGGYLLRAQGSSMLGDGIRDGDYVLFDSLPGQNLRDGSYVFSLDNEVLCKRLEFDQFKEKRKIKIFSVRVADLEKAELLETLDADAPETQERLHIFGRVMGHMRPK